MQDQLKGPSRTWWDLATACDRRVRENQIEGPWLPRRSRDYRRSVEPRAEISNRSAVNTTSAGVPYYTSVEHFDAYFLEWGRLARASHSVSASAIAIKRVGMRINSRCLDNGLSLRYILRTIGSDSMVILRKVRASSKFERRVLEKIKFATAGISGAQLWHQFCSWRRFLLHRRRFCRILSIFEEIVNSLFWNR